MSTPVVSLAGIATAAPSHCYAQPDVQSLIREAFPAPRAELDRLLAVFDTAGIDRRRFARPLDWLARPKGWRERNAAYLESADDLLDNTNRRALATAGASAADVDAIVTVSTTGLATPDLAARQMARLPFRRDVRRLPVFGLGCAGGVLGLARAADLARGLPGSTVLVQLVELCSLTFDIRDAGKANLVASALFGDGAASVVLRADPEGRIRIGRSHEHCWPGSLDVMGWRIEDSGLGVVFSRDIPTLVAGDFAAVLETFLERTGLRREDIDHPVCHPGGRKVIEALEAVFGRSPGSMTQARAVLREHGNMSSVSVLFVLEAVLRDGATGRLLLTALGPGFCAALLEMTAA